MTISISPFSWGKIHVIVNILLCYLYNWHFSEDNNYGRISVYQQNSILDATVMFNKYNNASCPIIKS